MQKPSERTKRRVLIISADRFEDSELLQPCKELEDAGFTVDIASLKRGTITGKHGSEVNAGLSTEELNPEEYGMLLLPGGKAPAELRSQRSVLALTHHFFQENKPVAAICHGPQILISAGLMEGRTATAYMSVADELKSAGANYVDEEVVVDGNLITSRMPDDIPAFVREIRKKLQTESTE